MTSLLVLLASAHAQCPLAFAAPTAYPVGSGSVFVASADLNLDGTLDLAVANRSSNSVSVLLGNAPSVGTFQAAAEYFVNSLPNAIAAGDFNGDGRPDLAVACQNGGVFLLLGNPTPNAGTFQPAGSYDAGSNPTAIAQGDFNGDGVLDLAVADSGANKVRVLLGNPPSNSVRFQPPVNYDVGTLPYAVVVADLNGDGVLDIAAAILNSDVVSILFGNPSPNAGTFQAPVNYNVRAQPYALAVGDLNGDGRPDLAVASNSTSFVSVLLNNAPPNAGTFQRVDYAAGDAQYAVAIGDLNGDGLPDLALAESNTNRVSILGGNPSPGAGTFQAPVYFPMGTGTSGVAIGDFNADGRPDLASAGTSGANVRRNTIPHAVIYVNHAAAGGNDGGNWANAFTELRDALALAAAQPCIQQIWVAAGTYKPASPAGSRSATFQLQNNLAIYGGFVGTETTLTQRNIAANPTILSGDLNGNDNGDLNRDDNSETVVSAQQVSSACILDGFTISAGGGDGLTNEGSGLLVRDGSPSIRNCIFQDCRAFYDGGAVIVRINSGSSNPSFDSCTFRHCRSTGGLGGGVQVVAASSSFVDCVFMDNAASDSGGALVASGSSISLVRCIFERNHSDVRGGAIYAKVSQGTPSSVVTLDCSFLQNTAPSGGAVLSNASPFTAVGCLFVGNISSTGPGGALNQRIGDARLINCTLVANRTLQPSATGGGGASVDSTDGSGTSGPASLSVTNCLLWANASAGGVTTERAQLDTRGTQSSASVSYTSLQGWSTFPGPGNSAADPQFLRLPSSGPDATWGTLDDDNGDLRVAAASSAIDSGNSAIFTAANGLNDIYDINSNGDTSEAFPIDLLSFPRFVDDPAVPNTGTGTPPVDRGCYESQVNCLTCPGPREWRSPGGGAFDFPGNWFPSVPQPQHDTLFNLASTYTVTIPTGQNLTTNSATFSAGSVTLDLGGGSLSEAAISSTSLTVGELLFSPATLSITNGTLAAVDARIGSEPGSIGTLNVGSGALLSTTRSLTVGFQGTGSLNITAGGRVFSRDASVGDQATSHGSVSLSGEGSRWDIPFFLIIDSGSVNVSSGASLTTGFGTYLFNGGTISGDGTINGPVVNFGAIAPGNSPGTLTINGTYQQVGQVVGLGNVSGQLVAQAAGSGAGQFDKLIVNGHAALGGGLSVSLMSNYIPAQSDNLQLVTATGGISTPFDVIFFPSLANTAASTKYFRAAYSGLRGPGDGTVTVNLGSLPVSPAFNPTVGYDLDAPPSNIAVGDLNGDGLPDVAVTIPDAVNPTTTTGAVLVLFNQGGVGTNWLGFAPHLPGNSTNFPPIPVGLNPKAAAIARLDPNSGSSVLNHLVVANSNSNNLSILRLAPGATPTLNIVATQATDPEPVGLAAADFTGLGGRTDVVVVACSGGAAASTGSMSLLGNTTTGGSGGVVSFVRRNIPAPTGIKPIFPMPFNPDQDKDLDLAVTARSTDGSADRLTIYTNGLNPGAPTPVPDLFNVLTPSLTVSVGALPIQSMAGRLARPSPTTPAGKREDVITVNTGGNSISVLINTNTTQDVLAFGPPVEYHFDVTGAASSNITPAMAPQSGALVDLDGSGTLDIAVVASNVSGTNRTIKLLRNDSVTSPTTGVQVAFAQLPDAVSGSKPLVIVAADIDSTGQQDLITINATNNRDNPNTVQVVPNALPSPAQSLGACCNGAGCLLTQPIDCAGTGQRFAGSGASCNAPGIASTPCCKGDFNQNGALSVQDIFEYLNAWFAGSLQADADYSATLSVQDIFDFLNAWFAGC